MSGTLLFLVFSFVARGQAFFDGSEACTLGLECPLSLTRVDANRTDFPPIDGPQLDELAVPDTDLADDLPEEDLRDCPFVAPVLPATNQSLTRLATRGSFHPPLVQGGLTLPLLC